MKTSIGWAVDVLFSVLAVVLAVYLLVPSPNFPIQMPGSLKSNEPADIESPLRQGFYTDWDRAQIMAYFNSQFLYSGSPRLPLPTVVLNYPPEQAQTIIRDQTKSRYLEEFVHPLRESIYVNGFFAQKPSEVMIVNGHQYLTKVIVKMVPSNRWVRLGVGLAALFLGYVAVVNLTAGIEKSVNV